MAKQAKNKGAMIKAPNNTIVIDNSPGGLIAQAIKERAPIEYLNGLMDLYERHEKEEARKIFLDNLVKFQSELPELQKTKKVNYDSKDKTSTVDYNYTPLPIIKKMIQPYLLKYGFSYRWEFDEDEKNELFTCWFILYHVNGHSERTKMTAGKDASGKKNNIQSIGSTRTYLQRYTMIAGLGLTTVDVDDDGRKSKAGESDQIPEPQEVAEIRDWSKNLNKCETIAQLESVINKMTVAEFKHYKKKYLSIKEAIETENKKSN